MPLHTVEPQRLYRQIAEQIRALIGAQEWGPGERLPAERDLARQLGVSRPSVREALIALEVEGWIEVRTGSGIYVRARGDQRTAAPAQNENPSSPEWGPLEVLRARLVVEAEVAALAARNANDADLHAIRGGLAQMRDQAQRQEVPRQGDEEFHQAIAAACGNGVLQETVQRYWQARDGALFERLGNHFENPHSWQAAIDEHQAVLQAIEARDAVAARRAMQQHLKRSHQRYSASWRRAPARQA